MIMTRDEKTDLNEDWSTIRIWKAKANETLSKHKGRWHCIDYETETMVDPIVMFTIEQFNELFPTIRPPFPGTLCKVKLSLEIEEK